MCTRNNTAQVEVYFLMQMLNYDFILFILSTHFFMTTLDVYVCQERLPVHRLAIYWVSLFRQQPHHQQQQQQQSIKGPQMVSQDD